MKFSYTSALKNSSTAFLTQRHKKVKTERKNKKFGCILSLFASLHLSVKNPVKFHNLFLLPLIAYPIAATEVILPGRDLSATYKIEIPDDWKTTLNKLNLDDTREPLATIEKEEIVINIHNFPSDSLLVRIPALAQVARWKNQFSEIDKNILKTTHVAWGGFSGLRFEAVGKQKGKQLSIIAWSLLIASNYYNKLNSQQRADVTIKAIGPRDEISQERDTIFKMAESFELIEGIPSE